MRPGKYTCWKAGYQARRANQPLSANPYPANGTPDQQRQHKLWERGWADQDNLQRRQHKAQAA